MFKYKQSNNDPQLSVQLDDVLTIITPISPLTNLNQWEDRFLSKSYDLTPSLPPDTLPNTYPPLLMSVKQIFPNTYTLCTVWEEMCNRCSADERKARGRREGEARGLVETIWEGERKVRRGQECRGTDWHSRKWSCTCFHQLFFFFFTHLSIKGEHKLGWTA